jgi:hypothetical protein
MACIMVIFMINTCLNALSSQIPSNRHLKRIIEFETYKKITKRKINEIIIDKPDNLKALNLKNDYQIYYSQIMQDRIVSQLYNTHSLSNKQGIFVEAGAYDGETWSNTLYLERFKNWTGLLIEPSTNNYKILKSKNRNSYTLNACLSGNNKNQVQYVEAGPFSITTFNKNDINNLKNVTCYSLAKVLKRFLGILKTNENIIDYMSLDIEGGEKSVIESFPWNDFRINLMSIEYNQNSTLYKWIIDFMEKFNYKEIFVDDKWYQDVYLAHESIIPYLNRTYSRVSELVF